jgi:hypothetical protein
MHGETPRLEPKTILKKKVGKLSYANPQGFSRISIPIAVR